jgi:hypothetical protein
VTGPVALTCGQKRRHLFDQDARIDERAGQPGSVVAGSLDADDIEVEAGDPPKRSVVAPGVVRELTYPEVTTYVVDDSSRKALLVRIDTHSHTQCWPPLIDRPTMWTGGGHTGVGWRHPPIKSLPPVRFRSGRQSPTKVSAGGAG